MKLRTFLLTIVGLTLVPLLGVAGVAIWWAHQDERRAMERGLDLAGHRDRQRARMVATLIDITEQKAADELRSMARLANAAAHEINNPLTMVLGRLAMLREDPSLPAEARDRIGQIHAAAERIREIVVDMNHLTRVQLYEHAGRGLPEMLDIRKSAAPPENPPAPR